MNSMFCPSSAIDSERVTLYNRATEGMLGVFKV